MNILFFKWPNFNGDLTISALKRLNHNVLIYERKLPAYEIDGSIMQDLVFKINAEKIDCIFTINYIPMLATVADVCGIKYVSWTQDSPAYPLFSPTRNYACNYQFVFDEEEYYRLSLLGSERIYHATLCSDPLYFSSVIESSVPIESDVCFVGTLYNETDFERIVFPDKYMEGYCEGLINAQKEVYGCNLIEPSLSEEFAGKILSLCHDEVPDGYCISKAYAASYILERKVTGLERLDYLRALSEHFNLSIYTKSKPEPSIKADYRGFAPYDTVMPRVFYGARINLHFAPRNIHSGVSLRVFDVLACKGFLLTTWAPEIATLFKDGEELVLFSCVDELLEKTDYYLKHEDIRKKIASNGYKKILKDFTYDKVLQGFFDVI